MRNKPRAPAPKHGKPAHGKPARGKPKHGPAHGKPVPVHGKPARGKPKHGPAKDTRHAQPEGDRSRAVQQARGRARRVGEESPHQRGQAARDEAVKAAPDRLRAAADLMQSRQPLAAGEWLWTMREGAERDLVEELLLAKDLSPRGFQPALVVSRRAPNAPGERLEATFARQGFQVATIVRDAELMPLVEKLAPKLCELLQGARSADERLEYALQVFVPDSNEGNRLAQRAQLLEDRLAQQLGAALPAAQRIEDAELKRSSVPLLQVCLFAQDTAAAGVIASDCALSLAAGGRTRMRLSGAAPSRAARKLEEAFAWLGMSPGPGELCVDLGAAPGGWTWLLLERRARVIAVDPARMDPRLENDRRLTHIKGDAFKFTPEQPVDWLFCDMVWRPIEVAQMLGRWARQRQTRMLVSNFKLPMKRKAEQVEQIRQSLAAAGFTKIRTRQLYHDRDEITLTAVAR